MFTPAPSLPEPRQEPVESVVLLDEAGFASGTADQAGRIEADLPRRVDQHLLWSPAAGRAHVRQRAPAPAGRTRDRLGQAHAAPAAVPLPGADGQRGAGERALPGLLGLRRQLD